MSKKQIGLVLFFIVVIAQLSIIGSVISGALVILNANNTIKLKCRLYDPFNFMKGRYIRLSFDIESINIKDMSSLKGMNSDRLYELVKMPLYCNLSEKNGYSIIEDASFQKPSSDKIFIKLKINYISEETIHLKIYFDQYYLQENYAIEAEKILRNSKDEDDLSPALILSVGKDGNVVQKGFNIKGIPIEEYIKNNLEK